jgi:ClpX C4-type zinc finger
MPGERTSGFGAGQPPSGTSEADLRCSFCAKRRDEVAKMIAGQRWQIGQHSRLVAICNECVALCSEMFAEQDQDPRDAPA